MTAQTNPTLSEELQVKVANFVKINRMMTPASLTPTAPGHPHTPVGVSLFGQLAHRSVRI